MLWGETPCLQDSSDFIWPNFVLSRATRFAGVVLIVGGRAQRRALQAWLPWLLMARPKPIQALTPFVAAAVAVAMAMAIWPDGLMAMAIAMPV